MNVALSLYLPKNRFRTALSEANLNDRRGPVHTVQVNLGKRCNQACHHCHVEAGPRRTEMMQGATAQRVIELLRASVGVRTLDITGGAPELNENFTVLVRAGRAQGLEVIDRCNLTVLHEEGQETLVEFLATHEVRVIASLPCYSANNVDSQRGKGVFGKSIEALQMLNHVGYGVDPALKLDLVYNPLGASLPPPQAALERDYKLRLRSDFGIEFNQLFTITNMPIKRFRQQLEREGKLEAYMQLLFEQFSPAAAQGVMCRDLLSVGWDGQLYDCDFNQMLELPVGEKRQSIWDVHSFQEVIGAPINVQNHCFGCTAGVGSSCTGILERG